MATYHRGEAAAQQRAGLTGQAALSLAAIGTEVPPVAERFLEQQPMIVVGAADGDGRLWASPLTGAPGFLTVPAPGSLSVDALPLAEDPLAEVLTDPARRGPDAVPVGMIALEPATRRRMRVNGRAEARPGGLRVALDQVIANCPKYLQKRTHRLLDPAERKAADTGRRVTHGTALTDAQQRTVKLADTFFVATASDRGDADASHRGGRPGFVRVLGPTLLRWPDYVGNAMLLTLGNLEVNPAAGLLFPGWEDGSALHLSGTARTVWDAAGSADVPGAQRMVEFSVTQVREITAASPLRWSDPEYSRFNPPAR
ncbi:pyridoxamine 5'-phosphate oxidase family protein [Streptomyces sp. GSL17-111]|uniref:pyridoxamine 5'-phosphate oxidase family protein n=1 Tax=Streptomyces sp. GSL17-111 TaxID=3121596 RepID=UPI0030F39C82